jgi:uncharacterized protein (TIGR02453 family)
MSNPTFSGFPVECLQFFDDLRKNNNREWFQEHKQNYTDYVLEPAKRFVLALGDRLKIISKGIIYDTRMSGIGSVLRIYRDMRFSKDKTPYNTRLRIFFWEGAKKKMENPGYFFVLDENGAKLYTGIHRFLKPMLTAYREAIIDTKLGDALEALLNDLKKSGAYEIGGTHYKRVPRGFDPGHQRADLLKFNGLYVSTPMIDPKTVTSSDLLDVCFDHCQKLAPLHKWLVNLRK